MSKITSLALLAVLAASDSLGVRPAYAAPPVALVEDVDAASFGNRPDGLPGARPPP